MIDPADTSFTQLERVVFFVFTPIILIAMGGAFIIGVGRGLLDV